MRRSPWTHLPAPGAPALAGRARPALAVVVLVALLAGCGGATLGNTSTGLGGRESVTSQYSPPPSSRAKAGRGHGAARSTAAILGAELAGPIRASGGPFLRDRYGRVVILHGVNAVEKNPPYELTVAPGKAWNFSAADAKAIASLGFDVVRLGILWEGLEPGYGGPDNPAVCTPGRPGNPHMYDAAVARSYLDAVRRTVDLLGRYHVYTLLDMHQDVFNQVFRGEGAPAWAVCTDLLPPVALGGRWSANYHNAALDIAVTHFWENDVVGDLQGQYDRVWGTVARAFARNPWIVGYDPYNEPFEPEVTVDGTRVFATELECFYTGRAHPGRLDDDDRPVTCPPDDPQEGVVPTIEKADPNHLVFVEPDIYSIRNRPNLLGPMDYPRLVLNFHAYCGERSPVTGNPTDVDACADHVFSTMLRRVNERALMSSRAQPGGPPLFLSEFGATSSSALLDRVTHYADVLQLGWTYWTWKSYDDPTGSADEALAGPSGQLAPTADVLSRPYAQAVAGTPVTTSFDVESGTFQLVYVPTPSAAPTIVFVPVARHYPTGYCTRVVGGGVISAPGASHLLVRASSGAPQVSVTITPGRCQRVDPAGHRTP